MGNYHTKLTTPLLRLGKKDIWTLSDAYRGTAIFGGTGSGKTSGSGQSLAHAFLKAGMGGLVLCAKPDEAELWVKYAKACGREKSIVLFRPDTGTRFNFLEYEMTVGSGGVNNVVELLLKVIEMSKRQLMGSNENQFWDDAIRELLRNTLNPLFHAYGRIDLDQVMQMINSGPRSMMEYSDPVWKQHSFCAQTLEKLATNPSHQMDSRSMWVIRNYWENVFGPADTKTRENIRISFTSKMALLFTGQEHELLCTSTNVVPEMTHEGAIWIVDMPAQIWSDVGILIQKICKYMWQRATQRRPKTGKERPVFLWCDEAHVFVDEYDEDFQSMARSSSVCSVYLSQGIDGYIKKIGGSNAREICDSLLGHFQTKIFHSNSSSSTNEWAADLIGKSIQIRHGVNYGESDGYSESRSRGRSVNEQEQRASFWGRGNRSKNRDKSSQIGSSYSESMNEALEYEIEPGAFGRDLASGGPHHSFMVDGIFYQTGTMFRSVKKNWLKARFPQRI